MKMVKEREKSEHYHSEKKGCQIEERWQYNTKGKEERVIFCKTHQKEICRCGWEIGFHYGVSSKKLGKKN